MGAMPDRDKGGDGEAADKQGSFLEAPMPA